MTGNDLRALFSDEKMNEKYQRILESLEDGYFEVDISGNLTFFNNALAIILEYPSAELTGMNYRRFMDAETAKEMFQTFTRVYTTGSPLKGVEWKIIGKNGAGRYVDASVALLCDRGGKITGFSGFARDVTDRRLTRKFLKESEDRYRQIFEAAPIGIFQYDIKGVILTCNPAGAAINNAPIGKLVGFNLLKNAGDADIRSAVAQSLAGLPGQFEGHYTSVISGRNRYIKANFVPVFSANETIVGGMMVVEDLTERKQAEDALSRSEQERAVLLARTNDLAVLLDPAGTIVNTNEKFANRFDTAASTMIGKCVWDYFPEPNRSNRKYHFDQVLATGKTVEMEDEREGIWHYSKLCPVPDASGKLVWVAVFARDITEQKVAEAALRHSEARYRSLAENSPGMILLIDPDGICRYVSSSVEKIMGFSPETVLGARPEDFLLPEEADAALAIAARTLKGEAIRNFEVRVRRKDGSFAVVEWEGSPIYEAGRVAHAQFLGRDVTDRKIAEEKLRASRRQLQKLSTHLLTSREQERAGIAREIHDDLGQTLTAIKMNACWLKNQIPGDRTQLIDRTEDAIRLVDSAIQTVRRISSELRPGLIDDLGLSAAIEWLAASYKKRSDINIHVSVTPEEIILNDTYSIALFRVFQESLTNVIRHSEATEAWVALSRKSDAVTLVITDNGIGITENALSKKESFGLIGMRERVHALGGKISVFKMPAGGTRVSVQVPISNGR